jgi:hypothetical protein
VSGPYLVNVTARRRLIEVQGQLAASDTMPMAHGEDITDALELERLRLEWPKGAKLMSVVRTRTYVATDVYMRRVGPKPLQN